MVGTRHIPALEPDMTCLWMRVCSGVHGVEPMVSERNCNSRILHGCRLADHDVCFVTDYKALQRDAGITNAT
jgi:hypothetical protein